MTAEVAHSEHGPTVEERLAELDGLVCDLLAVTEGRPASLLRSIGASAAGQRLLDFYERIRHNVDNYPDATAGRGG
jgi:hypothetical protein